MRARLRRIAARIQRIGDRIFLGPHKHSTSTGAMSPPAAEPALHCTICNIDWPHMKAVQFRAWCRQHKKPHKKAEEGYEHCPCCGQETDGIGETSTPPPRPLDRFEAYTIKRQKEFETYLEERGAA